jgi:hypothetical protein
MLHARASRPGTDSRRKKKKEEEERRGRKEKKAKARSPPSSPHFPSLSLSLSRSNKQTRFIIHRMKSFLILRKRGARRHSLAAGHSSQRCSF